MTELATLERKRLSDLHQIASQLGIKKYRKYRKSELAQMIYEVAVNQAAEQSSNDAGSAGVQEASEPTLQDVRETNGSADNGASDNGSGPAADMSDMSSDAPVDSPRDAFGEADTAVVDQPTETRRESDGESAQEDRQEQEQKKGQDQQRRGKQDRKSNNQGNQQGNQNQQDGKKDQQGEIQSGILDVLPDGFGFLRTNGYSQSNKDVYVSTSQIKRFNLRRGDKVEGQVRSARDGEKYAALVRIESVNGLQPQKGRWRQNFEDLTPLYPNERLRLEWKPNDIAPRVIDLVAPIGKGQRGLVVSSPKAGKTTILKQLAQSIAINYPETKLFVLLVDERPEEVTDWERSVEEADVISSTFDQPSDNHISVTELVLERVKRLVEDGEDVVVLLDSITRLARAYNLAAPASGRILSGGVDSTALYPPKKFFGAARNIEHGGSLTIVGSALVDTGSRMDEVIYEEFKGTGNMELHLDRKLANKRIYPAIDIEASGTRKEELLMETAEAQRVWQVRSILNALDSAGRLELLIQKIKETKTNAEFLRELQRVRS